MARLHKNNNHNKQIQQNKELKRFCSYTTCPHFDAYYHLLYRLLEDIQQRLKGECFAEFIYSGVFSFAVFKKKKLSSIFLSNLIISNVTAFKLLNCPDTSLGYISYVS